MRTAWVAAVVLAVGCGSSHPPLMPDASAGDAGLAPADSGTDSGGPQPPPGGPPPPPTSCDADRIDETVEVIVEAVSGGGCVPVSEGEVLAVDPWPEGNGVRYSLHEGFDGGSAITCVVSVRNIGVDVADDTAWSVGTIYAGLLEAGVPGELWLGDGNGWWPCGGGSVYPLIVHVGGHRETHVPIFTGNVVEPDWETSGCVRAAGVCQDFERPYSPALVDSGCELVVGPSASAGETTSFEVDGSARHLRTIRAWQELSCPVPGEDEASTSEYPDGAWVFWSSSGY